MTLGHVVQHSGGLVHTAENIGRLIYQIEGCAPRDGSCSQSLCTSALEGLRLAEMRAEAAERAQRELIVTAERKLQLARQALEQARFCIEVQQDNLMAVELHVEVAEADARQAKEAPALVEEAIRKRLLCANPERCLIHCGSHGSLDEGAASANTLPRAFRQPASFRPTN
jgi:hypothetical protein